MKITSNGKYNIMNNYRGGGGDFGDTYFYVVPKAVAEAVATKKLSFLQGLVIYAVTNIFNSDNGIVYPKDGVDYVLVTNFTRFTDDSVLNLVKTEYDVGPMYKLVTDLLDLGSEYMASSEVIETREDFAKSSASDYFLDCLDDVEERQQALDLLKELGYADLVSQIEAVLKEFEEADDE